MPALTRYQNAVLDSSGNGIAGATVEVTLAGTAQAAPLFADEEALYPISGNIVVTSSLSPGEFGFFAPEGRYDLTFKRSGVVVSQQLDVYLPGNRAVNPLRFMNAAQVADVIAGTLSVDVSGPLQACIDYAQDQDLEIDFLGLKYRLGAGLTWKHGRLASEIKVNRVRINGRGACFYPTDGVRAMSIVPRCLLADKASGRGEALIEISGLFIDGYFAPTTAKAFRIGAAGYVCSAFEWNAIDDITVSGFSQSNHVAEITDARHIEWNRLAIRTGTLDITVGTVNGFCGDMVFATCEFTGNETYPPVNIVSNTASSQIRGLTFSACDIYGSGFLIYAAAAGAQVGDIWFEDGTQFDGPGAPAGERALIVRATTGGSIFQIHWVDAYGVGYTGAVIYGSSADTATIRTFSINGGGFNNNTGDAASGNAVIFMLSVESVSIRGAEFDTCVATQLINIDACTNVVVHDNKGANCAGTTYGVSVGNASNNYSICNNMVKVDTAAVNDYTSGSPTKQVANNLKAA